MTEINPSRRTFRDRFIEFCVVITGARIFGHGRRVELIFSIAAGVYAIELLIVRNATSRTVVTEDLFWGGYGHYMLAVMWILFLSTSLGLLFNIIAWRCSQVLRIVGAFIGFWVWGWFGVKLTFLGVYPSPGQVLSQVLGSIGELMVIFNAAANLPRPGAPGNTGGNVGC
jgi:hypothetical protein